MNSSPDLNRRFNGLPFVFVRIKRAHLCVFSLRFSTEAGPLDYESRLSESHLPSSVAHLKNWNFPFGPTCGKSLTCKIIFRYNTFEKNIVDLTKLFYSVSILLKLRVLQLMGTAVWSKQKAVK